MIHSDAPRAASVAVSNGTWFRQRPPDLKNDVGHAPHVSTLEDAAQSFATARRCCEWESGEGTGLQTLGCSTSRSRHSDTALRVPIQADGSISCGQAAHSGGKPTRYGDHAGPGLAGKSLINASRKTCSAAADRTRPVATSAFPDEAGFSDRLDCWRLPIGGATRRRSTRRSPHPAP